MEVRSIRKTWHIEKYLCDICKDEIKRSDMVELRGGYDTFWEAHMCQKCVKKIADYVENTLGSKFRTIGDDEIPCPIGGTSLKHKGTDYIVLED